MKNKTWKERFTLKQWEVLKADRKLNPRILFLSGAMGSGKTAVLLIPFLKHVKKYIGRGVNFIIGGATLGSIKRNFLDDMEKMIREPIHLNIDNSFELWGNTVWCFEGKNSDSWKKPRGMNAAGALLGELTALNKRFVKEVESRCRVPGARIFGDTNPDRSQHWVKTEFLDKSGDKLSDGRINLLAFHFKLDDNTFLPQDYIESVKATTPIGVMYNRNILGMWTDETEASIYGEYTKYIEKYQSLYLESGRNKLFVSLDLGIGDGTALTFGTLEKEKLYILHRYINHGQPSSFYIDYIKEQAKLLKFELHEIVIILPHDSVKREDAGQFIASRYNTYKKEFMNVVKIQAIRVTDMIDNTRYHMFNKNILVKEGMEDFISIINQYSWVVDSDGVINSKLPDHGKEWNAPSNTVDSLEYLVFHTLGMPKTVSKEVRNELELETDYTREYKRTYKVKNRSY